MHLSLQISTFGHGTAPRGWAIEKRTEMQRLYYIKGGSGAYLSGDGQWEAFRRGCFYLFPYNFRAVFTSSTEQPILTGGAVVCVPDFTRGAWYMRKNQFCL